MTIDIIIPNYNGSKLIEKNLDSVLSAHSPYAGKIIIVDDGSENSDKKFLTNVVNKYKDENIILVEHEKNRGFSSAINTGVAKSAANFVVLLNSDVSPSKNFLSSLISKMEKDATIFGIGCMDESYEKGHVVKRGRGIAVWEKGMLVHSRGEVDKPDTFWISGGSCIIRRDLFNKIGGMDTLFNPFYWEDIDLSFRAQKSGYKVFFDKDSVVKHFHEEGSIKKGFKKEKITTTAYRNQFIFTWKNITSPNLLASHFIFLPRNILGAIRRGDAAFLKGLLLAALKLFVIISKRRKQMKLYVISDAFLLTKIS